LKRERQRKEKDTVGDDNNEKNNKNNICRVLDVEIDRCQAQIQG
jgi:hypothetical protein